jgi:hypothetical protein
MASVAEIVDAVYKARGEEILARIARAYPIFWKNFDADGLAFYIHKKTPVAQFTRITVVEVLFKRIDQKTDFGDIEIRITSDSVGYPQTATLSGRTLEDFFGPFEDNLSKLVAEIDSVKAGMSDKVEA